MYIGKNISKTINENIFKVFSVNKELLLKSRLLYIAKNKKKRGMYKDASEPRVTSLQLGDKPAINI